MNRILLLNKTGRFLLLIFVIVQFSCSNKNCENDNLEQLFFFNVSEEELQDVRIVGYEKNGEFNKVKDSSYEITGFEFGTYDGYTHIATLNKPLNLDLDYKIIYENINDSCLITDIIDNEDVCSGILIFKEYSHEIDGYKMNGKDFACDVLKAFPTRSP